ncbi:ester cyclase [Mesorhizobium sp. B2-4-17]|uniref:ester cyclase n=1 Tax=Mesorhizobium sp. B2-4-17 TaxID=2589932 RepID=UPI001128D10E|nr:ester cyclase [Mesorhizobium sp. B2-4-17]TPK78144.1 ester cyclase [Mesorhizobium sp. B2-4-17]
MAMTVEEATRIVTPLYEALNRPAEKDVGALLAKAAHPDYKSYGTNQDFMTRDQLAQVFSGIGKAIPDLRWTIEEVHPIGDDKIVVRGNATGTPVGEIFGAKPTGKSFETISIDLFTVRDGKLAQAYHVENWVDALEQMAKK